MNAAIDSQVRSIIRNTLGITGELNNEDHFWPDLSADSLDSVNLLLAFEREFSLEILDEEALKIQTVQQAIDFMQKELNK